jgi:DNA-binding NarL/FixJ family response regulator
MLAPVASPGSGELGFAAANGGSLPAVGIRVVLGEDSFLAREGIVSVLQTIEDVELVGVAGDLDSLREVIDGESPDVVLTDIRMPPTNTDEGIRLATELRSSAPRVGVVVLSQHAEPLYASALFQQGSGRRAYLLKERVKDRVEFARALTEVADGGSVVDPRIVDELLAYQKQQHDSRLDQLTPRELEILGLIAEGRSNTAIASQLVITKRAVERHINSIFWKLDLGESEDVSRRVKAVLLYLHGLSVEQAPA